MLLPPRIGCCEREGRYPSDAKQCRNSIWSGSGQGLEKSVERAPLTLARRSSRRSPEARFRNCDMWRTLREVLQVA
jgi:hypothetical protein